MMRASLSAIAAAWFCAFGGGRAAAVAAPNGGSTREEILVSTWRGDSNAARQLVRTGDLAAPSTTSPTAERDEVGLHVSVDETEQGRPSIQHQEGGGVNPGDRIEGIDEDWTSHASTSPAGAEPVLESARSAYAELSGEILVGVRGCGYAFAARLDAARGCSHGVCVSFASDTNFLSLRFYTVDVLPDLRDVFGVALPATCPEHSRVLHCLSIEFFFCMSL